MIYVFAIQLVSKQTLQGMVEHIKCSRILQGLLLSVVGLATVTVVFLKNSFISAATTDELPMDQIGTALLGSDKYQYVLPFEFISVFLLACIIGGLVVSRKKED
jgi:NADH-quinone oxidoreductase subunit J